jgi:protein-disulfide isomerase
MPSALDKLLGALTSTRSVVIAAPLVIGAGLLLAVADGQSETAAAKSEAKTAARSTAGQATGFTGEQEAAIGRIVRKYLLAHPELLVELSHELEKRQKAEAAEKHLKLISSQKDEIFHSPLDFVMGKKDAEITIVEFFDYNCGWCKRALKEVSALIKQEPNVRIVMKEFPIFGDHSEFAARAAMASRKQGKYWEFHTALMKERRVTKDLVFKVAKRVGLDVEKLKQEMDDPKYEAGLKRNLAIAEALGIQGTPGFIIDGQINPGYLPVSALRKIIADVRKNGCKIC